MTIPYIQQQASFVRKHGASHITSFFLDLNYMNDSRVVSSLYLNLVYTGRRDVNQLDLGN